MSAEIPYDVRVDDHDLNVYRGETFSVAITIEDGGSPRNLTSYTAKMTIRDGEGGQVYLTLTSSSGITLGGANGTVTVVITAAQTAAFNFEAARYDLLLKNGSDEVEPLIKGSLYVTPCMTEGF